MYSCPVDCVECIHAPWTVLNVFMHRGLCCGYTVHAEEVGIYLHLALSVCMHVSPVFVFQVSSINS